MIKILLVFQPPLMLCIGPVESLWGDWEAGGLQAGWVVEQPRVLRTCLEICWFGDVGCEGEVFVVELRKTREVALLATLPESLLV